MIKQFNEQLHCVCSAVVKFDDAVIVSKLADKFDLRTKEQRVYCRGCKEGKRKATEWLYSRPSLGELGVRQHHREK